MQEKCKKIESKVRDVETDIGSLNQYGRRNNIVFTVILGAIEDKQLECTVTSTLSDIDIAVDVNHIEDCHRFGKVDSKPWSKTTNVRLVSRRSR